MKLSIVVALLVFVSLASAQLQLLNPTGRGFIVGENGRAPCGQADTKPTGGVRTFEEWRANSVQQVEVLVHGAQGGGVIHDRYSCALNGDPRNNTNLLYPLKGGVRINVPNRANQVYRFRVRAPPTRCSGRATWQLIYTTNNGPSYYQCIDLRVPNKSHSGASMVGASVVTFLVAVIVALFM